MRNLNGFIKKRKRLLIIIFFVGVLIFVGVKCDIFRGYYLPNVNLVLKPNIKKQVKKIHMHEIKDVKIIDKLKYSDRLAVLYEAEVDGKRVKAIYIYRISNIGLLGDNKGYSTLHYTHVDNDRLNYHLIRTSPPTNSVRYFQLFLCGNNTDNYKKIIIEKYLIKSSGEQFMLGEYSIPINEGYYMAFVDIGELGNARLNIYYSN